MEAGSKYWILDALPQCGWNTCALLDLKGFVPQNQGEDADVGGGDGGRDNNNNDGNDVDTTEVDFSFINV